MRQTDRHLKLNNIFFFFENCAVYEMWKNTVERDRQEMTIWRMRIACCIPKATNTHSQCVIFLISHSNDGHTNAPHCYVIRTSPRHSVYCAVRAECVCMYVLCVCVCVCVCVCIYIYIYIYIYMQVVSGGKVNILGGGSMDYFE